MIGKSLIYRNELGNMIAAPADIVIYTPAELALRDGLAFLASTGMVSVPINQSLYMTIANPANSGKLIYLDERWFDSNRAAGETPLEYAAFINPTAVLTQSITPSNRKIGDGATVALVTYQAGGSITFGGTAGSTAPMPTGGIRQIISLPVAITPGSRLASASMVADRISIRRRVSVSRWYGTRKRFKRRAIIAPISALHCQA